MNDLHRSMILDKLARMKARHPVVLRFAEMFPSALARYEMHAARKGGKLDHIDPERSGSNRLLIGGADWREKLEQEIRIAAATNLAEELEALQQRKRWKEIEARIQQGKQGPWRSSVGGPLREVILTAHRDWFAGQDEGETASRAQRFEAQAVEWLQSRFGDAVVHARADHDEMTYHIHAILAPWVEKTSTRRGTQRVIQPSSNPLLKHYEAAQDDVGEFFATIGLKRGQRRAEKRREIAERIAERERKRAALAAKSDAVPADLSEDQDPRLPDPVRHKPTPVWWAEEKERLDDEAQQIEIARRRAAAEAKRQAEQAAAIAAREAELAGREGDAKEVVEAAEAIAAGKARSEVEPAKGFGPLTARFIAAWKQIQSDMRASATAKARAAVDAELQAVATLRTSVEALRDKLGTLLPSALRRNFDAFKEMTETPIAEAAKRAEEARRTARGEDR